METRLLIGGQQVDGEGASLAVENPATQETVADVGSASPAQVDAAVAAAAEAFPVWSGTPALERGEMLHEVATRLRAAKDELARVMTLEGGKPLVENSDEVDWTAAAFDFYAELGRASAGRVIPPIESTQLALVTKEPMGVVGAIVPWNYPLLLLSWKLAPALAAGNTVVAKPSEVTPLSTLMLAPMFDHLPAGALSLLAGAGDVGGAIVADERVDCVAFTGLGGHRQEDRLGVRRAGGADEPGDGRQGPVHRLPRRGRRHRDRRPRRGLGRLPERRPGVHVGRAVLRARVRIRRLRGRVRGPYEDAERRRPVRPRDGHRADGLVAPARQGGGAGRGRRGRGRRAADRRRPGRARRRPLLRPRRGHRPARRDRPAARGDLRAGGPDRAR